MNIRYILHKCTAAVAIAAAVFSQSSCRDDLGESIVNPNTFNAKMTYTDQFKAIWTGVSERYAMWDIEETNWDSLYNVYLPRFQAADAAGKLSDEDFEAYYTDLFKKFRDYHMAAIIKNQTSGATFTISPAMLQKRQAIKDGTASYSMQKDLNYGKDQYFQRCFQVLRKLYVDGAAKNCHIVLGNDLKAFSANIEGVAYLHTSAAALCDQLTSNAAYLRLYADFIKFAKSDECKGVIIDTRHNTGGSTLEFQLLCAPFSADDIHIGKSRQKASFARYDYAPLTPFYIEKNTPELLENYFNFNTAITNWEQAIDNAQMALQEFPEDADEINHGIDSLKQLIDDVKAIQEFALSEAYDRPVVALANSYSISMGEMMPFAISQISDKCRIFGTRTFGGLSGLDPDAVDRWFTGIFGDQSCETVPYYIYEANGFSFFGKEKKVYESKGIPPTNEVVLDYDAFNSSQPTDSQLSATVSYILQQ